MVVDFLITMEENGLQHSQLPLDIKKKIIEFNKLSNKEGVTEEELNSLDDEIDEKVQEFADELYKGKKDVHVMSSNELKNEKVLKTLYNEGKTNVSIPTLVGRGFNIKGVPKKGGTFGDYKLSKGFLSSSYNITKL